MAKIDNSITGTWLVIQEEYEPLDKYLSTIKASENLIESGQVVPLEGLRITEDCDAICVEKSGGASFVLPHEMARPCFICTNIVGLILV